MHSSIQKTAAPSWEEIKSSIAGGWAKAVEKTPEGMQKFLENHGTEVGRGLAGATIAGGLYGVTASRRSYESDEEFRRRRFRGALQTAALGGTLGALSRPISNFLEKKIPEVRRDLNQHALHGKINTDPNNAHGNLRMQQGLAAGMKPEDIAPGVEGAAKPTWMQAGEGAEIGTTVTGAAVGAYGGQRLMSGVAETIAPKLDPAVAAENAGRQRIVDIENAKRTPVPGLGKVPLSRTGQAALDEIKASRQGTVRRGLTRGAVRGTGGIAGGIAGGLIGNHAGEAIRDWIAPGWYDPNFVDHSAAGLATPGT